MNGFDAKPIVDKILAQYAVGDMVPPDAVDEFIELPQPDDSVSYGRAKQIIFDRLSRIQALRSELLTRKVLAVLEGGALALIKQEHHVDRAMRRVQRKVDKILLRGMNEVENLDMAGLPNRLITEQHDAMARLDALRAALNPRSRRTQFGGVIKAIK